jgi:hypothetical protein
VELLTSIAKQWMAQATSTACMGLTRMQVRKVGTCFVYLSLRAVTDILDTTNMRAWVIDSSTMPCRLSRHIDAPDFIAPLGARA